MKNWSDGLNESQKEAASTLEGVLLVLAGAGSGKTKMMTHRICHLLQEGVPASQILGITFTNKAAKEMRERMEAMLGEDFDIPTLTTFHSFGYSLLKRFGSVLDYKPHLGICDDEDRKKRLKEEMKSVNLPWLSESVDLSKDNEFVCFVEKTISTWKDNMLTDEEVASFRDEKKHNRAEIATSIIYEMYNANLKRDNQVDFDDLISKSVMLMEDKVVCNTINSEIRHVSVDEFQDTSVAQCRLVELLSIPSGEDGSLCVVGDDYQSIYAFRGAKVANILNFSKLHKGCKTVMLGENYRSTKVIVEAAASVIGHNTGQLKKELFSMNEEGERITVNRYDYDSDEAKCVAVEIASKIKKGKSPSDFAILYRNNSMSRKIEEALIKAGIPYKIFGGVSFYQRKEIKDIVAYLRLAAGFNDSVALKRIANVPKRKIGAVSERNMAEAMRRDNSDKTLLEKLSEYAITETKFKNLSELLFSFRRKVVNGVSLSDLLKEIVEDIEYEKYLIDNADPSKEGEDYLSRWSNVWQLIEKAEDFEENYKNEHNAEDFEFQDVLDSFLEEIALLSDIDTDTDAKYVSLMTMHKSKGLEFDTVFVINCSNQPKELEEDRDGDFSQEEEERRLFYVAMTRAKKKLYLSYSTTVYKYGQRVEGQEISQFIREIPIRYKETISLKSEIPKNKVAFNKYTKGYEYGSYGW